MVFVTLIVVHFIHSVCFFLLIRKIGSLRLSVLKICNNIFLLLSSHLLFCQEDSSQCITIVKVFSGILLFIGSILFFNNGNSRHRSPSTVYEEHSDSDENDTSPFMISEWTTNGYGTITKADKHGHHDEESKLEVDLL